MKTDKITRILMLYSQLIKGNKVNKSLFSLENGINERSFDRDVEDIRLFLSDSYSVNELVFDKTDNAYYITNQIKNEMDSSEVYVIAKALLGSKVLRKDELECVLDSLMSVISRKDARTISSKLLNDLKGYDGVKHDKAILKFVRDLSDCISESKYIRVKYQISNNTIKDIEVYPKDIRCEDSRFVLYAAETRRGVETKYLIDKIVEFEIIR